MENTLLDQEPEYISTDEIIERVQKGLSKSEYDVFRDRVIQRMSIKKIAKKRHLAPITIKKRLSAAYLELGLDGLEEFDRDFHLIYFVRPALITGENRGAIHPYIAANPDHDYTKFPDTEITVLENQRLFPSANDSILIRILRVFFYILLLPGTLAFRRGWRSVIFTILVFILALGVFVLYMLYQFRLANPNQPIMYTWVSFNYTLYALNSVQEGAHKPLQ